MTGVLEIIIRSSLKMEMFLHLHKLQRARKSRTPSNSTYREFSLHKELLLELLISYHLMSSLMAPSVAHNLESQTRGISKETGGTTLQNWLKVSSVGIGTIRS
jgi:hypothetical protein